MKGPASVLLNTLAFAANAFAGGRPSEPYPPARGLLRDVDPAPIITRQGQSVRPHAASGTAGPMALAG